jgi:hypothetical protein
VCFPKKRLADDADGYTGGRGFDGRPKPGAAGTDDENVVIYRLVFRHFFRSDGLTVGQS